MHMQIANFWFASAPGHPALEYLLEKIHDNAAARLYDDPSMDTLCKTGPGMFTEAVLLAALKHPPSKAGDR